MAFFANDNIRSLLKSETVCDGFKYRGSYSGDQLEFTFFDRGIAFQRTQTEESVTIMMIPARNAAATYRRTFSARFGCRALRDTNRWLNGIRPWRAIYKGLGLGHYYAICCMRKLAHN